MPFIIFSVPASTLINCNPAFTSSSTCICTLYPSSPWACTALMLFTVPSCLVTSNTPLFSFVIYFISSSFNSYSFGVFISFITYVLSTYSPVIVNFPSVFVTCVFASSVPSSYTAYVAPSTILSFPFWYFVISKSYCLAIMYPTLFGSVFVLYFPSSVSKLKYTAWWLYDTSLYDNPSGILISYDIFSFSSFDNIYVPKSTK